MIMTKEQMAEMAVLVEPVMKWININGHPHMKIIIDNSTAELVEGIATHHNDKYVPD